MLSASVEGLDLAQPSINLPASWCDRSTNLSPLSNQAGTGISPAAQGSRSNIGLGKHSIDNLDETYNDARLLGDAFEDPEAVFI